MRDSQFYDADFEMIYPEGMENYYWTLSRNRILFSELSKHSLANKKILEVGCGKGLVVSFLRNKGINIWGSELGNPKILENAKEWIYVNKNCMELPENFRKSIEVIMLLDVIEHIEYPMPFLENITSAYPAVKHIYISVPARKELWSSFDVIYRHFRRYDFNLIQNMVSSTSFKIIDIKYVFRILYLPALLAAKTTGSRKSKIKAPKGLLSIFIHQILANILYIDYILFPKKIYGSSIFCLLQKEQ